VNYNDNPNHRNVGFLWFEITLSVTGGHGYRCPQTTETVTMSQVNQKSSEKHNGTIVSYDAIEKTYGEGSEAVTAIKQFEAGIDRGEFVSVVGPSGCGKSTLLHLTTGILEPTQGTVRVDRVDVQTEEHEKHKIGLVFQKPVLLDWRTTLDNILLPVEIMVENNVLDEKMDYYRERAHDLIDLVGLDGFADSYPEELSGGMQQRVSICRSLIYDPPILLMDEPFGALDALTRDKMNDELLRIWTETNKTVLFVTHNLEEAVYLSDRVVVLSERPATTLDVIDVHLPRPREESIRRDEDFQSIVAEVEQHFRSSH
jgi:NitT/TauT family transport system ATP-binding protein